MNAVLQAKDVGLLAGLTENAVKQWTIGRPYAIRPSIRQATGKGVPNLYSLNDALRFKVAIELTADGFQSGVIQRVLDSFDATAKTLLVKRDWVEFSHLTMLRCAKKEEAETREFVQRSLYVLDLKSLREALRENWAQMLRTGLLHGANSQDRKSRMGKKAVEGKDRKTIAGR
jgi:hypothetical protein